MWLFKKKKATMQKGPAMAIELPIPQLGEKGTDLSLPTGSKNEQAPSAGQTSGSDVDHIKWLMNAIVIVLFVGFAQMFVATANLLWQAWTEKATTYQNLIDKVNMQNEKIDQLIRCQKGKTNSASSTC